jgi:hypothetical protein
VTFAGGNHKAEEWMGEPKVTVPVENAAACRERWFGRRSRIVMQFNTNKIAVLLTVMAVAISSAAQADWQVQQRRKAFVLLPSETGMTATVSPKTPARGTIARLQLECFIHPQLSGLSFMDCLSGHLYPEEVHENLRTRSGRPFGSRHPGVCRHGSEPNPTRTSNLGQRSTSRQQCRDCGTWWSSKLG